MRKIPASVSDMEFIDASDLESATEIYSVFTRHYKISRLMACLRWVELGRTEQDLFIRALFYPSN